MAVGDIADDHSHPAIELDCAANLRIAPFQALLYGAGSVLHRENRISL